METEKAILGRRSVREYQDKPVPEDAIAKLLKAGAMAPSAMDAQPCRFIVITDKAKIREVSDRVKSRLGVLGLGARIAERMKLKEDVIFYGAPLLIFIAAEKGDARAVDCALAAQNMFLQAYDLGLGSCFIGFASWGLKEDKETLRSLGITDSQDLVCPLIFGYPKSWPHGKNREPKIQNRIKG
jgi:nitroreductase